MKRSMRLAVLIFGLLALLAAPAAVADPPIVSVNDQSAEAMGPSGAPVSYTVSVTANPGPADVVCSPPPGSTFPLGTTSVSCTATDAGTGETSTASANVNVKDTTPPSITVPGSKTAEATGPSGASVGFSGLSASDTVSGGITPSCNHGSGSTFPLGTTTVNCTATDGSGNSASGSFTVKVQDTTPPVINVPGGQTVEATGPSGASVSYSGLSATDTVSGSLAPSCNHPPGSTLPLGTTSVSCTATDGSGNSAGGNFSVTVKDTTPPVLNVPGGQTVEATGPSGAVVSYSGVSASDTVSGNLTATCSKGSGTAFPLGATTVNCTATDGAGNSRTGSFRITVKDTKPPAVTVPAGKAVEATGPATAVTYAGVAATDTVSGNLTPQCTKASGSTFPVGTTTVTCTATDGSGNSASGNFAVTVKDTTPPVVTVPGGKTVEATGPATAVGYSGVSATDLVSGGLTPACTKGSGSTFPLGATTVTCTATDGSGNKASKSFTVTVRDTTAPSVTVPASITAEAQSTSGASVAYSGVSATDTVSGNLTPSCDHGSGSTFPLGATTVTCTATDGSGNKASKSFTVTVRDTTGPGFGDAPGDIVVEASGPKGSKVTFAAPTAVDAVDGPVSSSCSPGSGGTFPLGSTTVDCHAKDQRGNERGISFVVTVADKTAPVLTVPAPVAVSSAGAENLPASVTALATFLSSPVASDLVDGKLPVKVDAPAVFGVGTTTVKFSAADKSGNIASSTSTVTVVKGAVAPTKPLDRTPPDNVRGLRAKAADRSVTLRWRPPADKDFAHVVISRSTSSNPETQATGPTETTVYKGPAKKFIDRRLTNGVDYRYVVVSYDQAGNRSAGVAIVAAPEALLLVSPSDGARVTKPPHLRWVFVPGATFYNVQLFRGPRRIKVMTIWPSANHLQLPSKWSYAGHRQQLVPGLYHWVVWPGFGRQIAKNYGPLLGESSFTVVAAPKKRKK
jgi:large repetitive protein